MVAVRRAVAKESGVVAGIAHDAYDHYTARIGRPARPMSADYAALVAAGDVWVAVEDGAVLGYVVLLDRPDHLLVDNLAVGPAAQQQGVGARLLAFADDEARRRGHGEVRLCTNVVMTENIAYYPRRGFVETHRAQEHGYHRVYFAKIIGDGA